ncbi:unannotated protein [freshwater metagenome]|uniref:Unannotated protein n=1 Tax=freshwater metagenome TaxID=449393 RepID=A0A6J7HZ79_9ZZZZ
MHHFVAHFDGVEGWLGGKDSSCLKERPHVVVDQGEQQTPDVTAVDIGIAQNDDPAVSSLVKVEIGPRACTDCGEERLSLSVFYDLFERGFTSVDYLSAQRKHGHVLGVASGLGRPGSGISLYDQKLCINTVPSAISELVGHRPRVEIGGLSASIKGGLGRHPIDDSLSDFVSEGRNMGLLASALDPVCEVISNNLVHDALNSRRTEFLFGLALELRLWERHFYGSNHALLDIAFLGAVLAYLCKPGQLLCARKQHIVRDLGHGTLKTSYVRATFNCGNGIDEAAKNGFEPFHPPNRNIHGAGSLDYLHDAIYGNLLFEGSLTVQGNDLGNRLAKRQGLYKVSQAAFSYELFGLSW